MDLAQLETEINAAWDNRDAVNADTKGAVRNAVQVEALNLLDNGKARVAEPTGNHQWVVNQWLKKAVLLSFRLNEMQLIPSGTIFAGAGESAWWDKVAPKFSGWDEPGYEAGSARYRDVLSVIPLMLHLAWLLCLALVNLVLVDRGTMVDTWATVDLVRRLVKMCIYPGGAGIGGVLEPLQAGPVIIEDDCFIGARSEVVEGVVVEQGMVLSMGVFVGASPKIVDRETGEIHIDVYQPIQLWCQAVCPASLLPMAARGHHYLVL